MVKECGVEGGIASLFFGMFIELFKDTKHHLDHFHAKEHKLNSPFFVVIHLFCAT